jgi:methylamine dehydrogenase heavy chain
MNKLKNYAGWLGLAASGVLAASVLAQDSSLPPLPIEATGTIESLPGKYPDDWFLVHDAAFFHMSDGKVYVIDTSADTVAEQIKGMFNVVFLGNIAQSRRRGEIYATETFYSRGTRGTRTDALTIWDMSTLAPKGEVVWPVPKRYSGMPQRFAVTPIDNDNLLLVLNFTPATSVTVIDLDTRKILNEVAIPGCLLAYPTGKRGFSSLCADGRFMSTQLSSDGSVIKQSRGEVFFSSDDSPIFEHTALIDGTAYFPSFTGKVFPVDMSGKVAKVGVHWDLVTPAERAGNWRPGGIGIIDEDELGRFYVLMHPDGVDGSQNGGGSEVWVFDPSSRERVLKIPLKVWGLTLAVSRGKQPKLLVTNPTDMTLELYDGRSGEFIRSIKDFGQETPLMLHAAHQD